MILELSVLCHEMLIFSYGALEVSRSGIFNYNVQLFSRLLVNIFSTCKHIFIFCFCAIKSPLFFISVLKITNYFLVFFFFGIELLYKVLLVSAVHQRESARHVHMPSSLGFLPIYDLTEH